MQNLDIPISIWLNAGVLVAAAAIVWLKLAAASSGRPTRKSEPAWQGTVRGKPP